MGGESSDDESFTSVDGKEYDHMKYRDPAWHNTLSVRCCSQGPGVDSFEITKWIKFVLRFVNTAMATPLASLLGLPPGIEGFRQFMSQDHSPLVISSLSKPESYYQKKRHQQTAAAQDDKERQSRGNELPLGPQRRPGTT